MNDESTQISFVINQKRQPQKITIQQEVATQSTLLTEFRRDETYELVQAVKVTFFVSFRVKNYGDC
jgi:hypothetical protein